MNLREAVLKYKSLQQKYRSIKFRNMAEIDRLEENGKKYSSDLEEYGQILGEAMALKYRILKTNLSYNVEIESAEEDKEPINVTIQELFNMIKSNTTLRYALLDILAKGCILNDSLQSIKEQETYISEVRLPYLCAALDKVDTSIDLMD